MAHSCEYCEFDLGPGDRLVIGDLVLTIHDLASSEACVLVEAACESDVSNPLAQVVCD